MTGAADGSNCDIPVLLQRDFHNTVASRLGFVDRFHDGLHISLQHRPLWIADHHDGNPMSSQVLLVRDILVGREQKLKSISLSNNE